MNEHKKKFVLDFGNKCIYDAKEKYGFKILECFCKNTKWHKCYLMHTYYSNYREIDCFTMNM